MEKIIIYFVGIYFANFEFFGPPAEAVMTLLVVYYIDWHEIFCIIFAAQFFQWFDSPLSVMIFTILHCTCNNNAYNWQKPNNHILALPLYRRCFSKNNFIVFKTKMIKTIITDKSQCISVLDPVNAQYI